MLRVVTSCLKVSLALLLMTAANAQEPPREYLIRLGASAFPASLRAQGITPIHHSGKVWAVRTSDEKTLRQTTEEVTPATSVIIELQPNELQDNAQGVIRAVAAADGLLTRRYHSISAVSAIVPTSKIGDLQKLPGVKRIHKDHSHSALHLAPES